MRWAFAVTAAAATLTGCGGWQPTTEAPGSVTDIEATLQSHRTFHYTGKKQSFVVPPGVRTITVVARGAGGGGAGSDGNLSGRGGRVHAIIPVVSGERLYVFVGGTVPISSPLQRGGYNGGGKPGDFSCCGRGGGGASDVRKDGDALNDRILVAGGGGGQGAWSDGGFGGPGGGMTGGSGGSGDGVGPGGGGGGAAGGSQDGGGPGGAGGKHGYGHGQRGESGTLGDGGIGGHGGVGETGSTFGGAGGGGGGGYYGGGGGGGGQGGGGGSSGASGGGGGGGSSYVEPRAKHARIWQGWKNATGDGLVVFSW